MTPQDLLRLHPFFSTLTARETQDLLRRARCKDVPTGQVIFQKDEAGEGLYGVLAGRVAFTVNSADGKELILDVLGAGEFFGEIALLDGKGHTATAVARDASRLLFIARKEFMYFFGQRPDAMLHIHALLCARLRHSTDYIADAAFLDLPKRLAKQLVNLENGDGSSRKAALRISHAELAAMLGVSRERVSKQLAAWSDKGILEQGRGRLVIRDKQALEHVIANGSGQVRSKRVDGSAHRLPARLQSRAAVSTHRRRFSAVLHADLAGFVGLMEGAEERRVSRVLAAQAEVWRPAIDTAGGRVVNTVGASLLAEFSSAMSAVAAAIDIQERMAWFNDMLDDDQWLMFRIGLHLGEVIVDESQNIFGDGVEVAARIQLMAEPGGVVVSRAVRDVTHLHIDHPFVDGREHQGGNISRSLQVYHLRARKNASTRTTTSIVPRATLRLRGTDRDGGKYAFDVKLDELMTRREGIVIGRDVVQCGLVLSHSTVSRRHARLIFAGGVLQIEDLGSTNGTSVDREEARPGKPQMLQAGVTLKIGGIELSVEGN